MVSSSFLSTPAPSPHACHCHHRPPSAPTNETLREMWIAALANGANQGCGHVRLMIERVSNLGRRLVLCIFWLAAALTQPPTPSTPSPLHPHPHRCSLPTMA
jgi:hypothetical protein